MEDRILEVDAPPGGHGAGMSGEIRFDGRVAIVTFDMPQIVFDEFRPIIAAHRVRLDD